MDLPCLVYRTSGTRCHQSCKSVAKRFHLQSKVHHGPLLSLLYLSKLPLSGRIVDWLVRNRIGCEWNSIKLCKGSTTASNCRLAQQKQCPRSAAKSGTSADGLRQSQCIPEAVWRLLAFPLCNSRIVLGKPSSRQQKCPWISSKSSPCLPTSLQMETKWRTKIKVQEYNL